MTQFDFLPNTIAAMKFMQYEIIATHMFQWKNLPNGLDSEVLERMLIHKGAVSLFNTTTGLYVLPFSSSGTVNVYGNLTNVVPVPSNGIQLVPYDTVPRILYDNSTLCGGAFFSDTGGGNPFVYYLRAFSQRLAEIQKSIFIYERMARLPSIIKVTEIDKASWGRFETKIDHGDPVIFVDQAFDLNNLQVLPTGFNPATLQALWQDYNKVEGEIYTMLGTMYNVEQNKAAGVGPAETVMNYAQTFAFAQARLDQRQRWCEKINKEFGLGVSCERNNDNQMIIEEMMSGAPQAQAIKPNADEDAEVKDDASKQTRRLRTA